MVERKPDNINRGVERHRSQEHKVKRWILILFALPSLGTPKRNRFLGYETSKTEYQIIFQHDGSIVGLKVQSSVNIKTFLMSLP